MGRGTGKGRSMEARRCAKARAYRRYAIESLARWFVKWCAARNSGVGVCCVTHFPCADKVNR